VSIQHPVDQLLQQIEQRDQRAPRAPAPSSLSLGPQPSRAVARQGATPRQPRAAAPASWPARQPPMSAAAGMAYRPWCSSGSPGRRNMSSMRLVIANLALAAVTMTVNPSPTLLIHHAPLSEPAWHHSMCSGCSPARAGLINAAPPARRSQACLQTRVCPNCCRPRAAPFRRVRGHPSRAVSGAVCVCAPAADVDGRHQHRRGRQRLRGTRRSAAASSSPAWLPLAALAHAVAARLLGDEPSRATV